MEKGKRQKGKGNERRRRTGRTYPFQRIKIQLLNFAMTKEGSQADAVVGYMWFFADDDDFVLALGVEFDEFFAVYYPSCQLVSFSLTLTILLTRKVRVEIG